MVETDWREILSFSQKKDLTLPDKEKICESLCWMEADDIELNFTDLKMLFRLAQEILKLKSEQVHNLVGQLKTVQKKSGKMKIDTTYAVSPTQSNDSALETITHQEEIIKANKEILEQLYADIADLESKKSKLEESKSNFDIDSESSRDALSEMNAVAELEREVTMKNKHIRKLLGDVKILEDENSKLKDKVSILKDKLTEATQLIDNLTEQMLSINNECSQLKEILGKSQQEKAQLSIEIEGLKKEIIETDSSRENVYESIKSKLQHWKVIAKAKKAEVEALNNENIKLKQDLKKLPKTYSSPDKHKEEKIKELQDKLLEASSEMEHSADLINLLRDENKKLQCIIEDIPNISVTDIPNQSDDGKEQIIINKLRKKVKSLTINLRSAEDLIGAREKEIAEITAQLQLLKSDEGINTLLERLKNKKSQLKFKDDGIKTLIKEANSLNQLINDLQLENETLRQKCNIPLDEKISTKGIIKDYHELQSNLRKISQERMKLENKLVEAELLNHHLNSKLNKLSKTLHELGHSKDTIIEIINSCENDECLLEDHAMEHQRKNELTEETAEVTKITQKEMISIIEENKGLRQSLQEMLDFLKDNSTSSSGILTLQCPSLDKILCSMEARNTAGWLAPHMTTVMELRTALGSKDALLTALHEARKETFDVMDQLTQAKKISAELELKLQEIELKNNDTESKERQIEQNNIDMFEFGSWISEKDETDVDFYDKGKIDTLLEKGNSLYECQLKKALQYFHKKFKDLFEKLTAISIQASDDQNKWSFQEDKYKAEIQNLKSILQQDDDDSSDCSPGIVPVPNIALLKRKCTYLEKSYGYVRTQYENLKNEILENKKEAMLAASEYEDQIQKLLYSVVKLTDKLRYSISIELFWKLTVELNDITSKYRKIIEGNLKSQFNANDLLKRLEDDRINIINRVQIELKSQGGEILDDLKKRINNDVEPLILQKQLQLLCTELSDKNKDIEDLEKKVIELQDSQGKLIDEALAAVTKKEVNFMKDQIKKINDTNKVLKEQCHHVSDQLDIALMQLQDSQQRQISNDMEINMLHHQILDLQSTSDNKAIIARLSGEVLVAHLQVSECHKKIERLNAALSKEKYLRTEAEEMLIARQKVFDVYALRYEYKFRYIYEVMQTLRQQYQGSIPRSSIENYLNKSEELSRKHHAVNEKLSEIEDLQSNLIAKHNIFDQILDISKDKCVMGEESCPHKLKYIMDQSISSRELEHMNKKIQTLDKTREELIIYCNHLEKTLVLVNQGFEKTNTKECFHKNKNTDIINELHVEDIHSDDDSSTRKSKTNTLPKPQILPPSNTTKKTKKFNNSNAKTSPKKININLLDTKNVTVQTISTEIETKSELVQTVEFADSSTYLEAIIGNLKVDLKRRAIEFSEAINLAQKRTEEVIAINAEKVTLETKIDKLKETLNQRDTLNKKLLTTIEELKTELNDSKKIQLILESKIKNSTIEENKSLLLALNQLENDKNSVVIEYKGLLNNEREEYAKSVKELHVKVMELQSQLDRRGSDSSSNNGEALKEVITKYTVKIAEYEDKCFKLQSELDEYKTDLSTYQSEADRWKELAAERLTKMEQLNSQLEERHCYEVKSYKAENQHWISQLSDMQREHMDLRNRLTEQKTSYVKQLADKDSQIEQLRVVVMNLKTQIMNMQTIISAHDPSFDLSAIVEVDESCDVISTQDCDKLEIKFDSSIDLHDSQEDISRIPASSTSIWQESVIERLRREKQLAGKQNAILRRQMKLLAARERRARLDAQNLKNQVFRISTTGSKVTTAETAALHNKIATLQAQLMSARRDTNSSVALWDKWKKAQQLVDRWQARYEEKNQEVTKLMANLQLTKSAVSRLEKEKRVLLTRLNEVKCENSVMTTEKQEIESQEKSHRSTGECVCMGASIIPVSSQALLGRVEAQQRRIAALEVAEKGNEVLVAEYERSLAEVTSLKGQVLKLESTLLESEIRNPLQQSNDTQSELDYWKSYCNMLKEENVQLTQKINSMETLPTTTHQHRVNDLEQTVLTLRGVINKLQSEHKSSGSYKKTDSRPNSSRSSTDKGRTQQESHRIEIANLKRTINDKDLLLERSKEMLKIAAEREDELLRENAFLRRQLEDISNPKEGFLSA